MTRTGFVVVLPVLSLTEIKGVKSDFIAVYDCRRVFYDPQNEIGSSIQTRSVAVFAVVVVVVARISNLRVSVG